MTDVFVGNHTVSQGAHYLMHLDQHAPAILEVRANLGCVHEAALKAFGHAISRVILLR